MKADRTGMVVKVNDPEAFFDSVIDLVKESGCELYTMQSLDDDLESIFHYLVG
jgi:hypothetical protein